MLSNLVLSTFASMALAVGDDCCDGDDGWELIIDPAKAALGSDVDVTLIAPSTDLAFLMASLGQGPIDSSYGPICLDFPLFFKALVPLGDTGTTTLGVHVPDDSNLCGLVVYAQFITCRNNRGASNQASLRIYDEDCDECDNGKPSALTMVYTGLDCSATDNFQGAGFVECEGDPALEGTVHIIASDKQDPTKHNAKVFFDGEVDLGDEFVIDSANGGADRLGGNTYVFISDLDGNLLQQVKFHTSCSQPLVIGDQYGGLLLAAFEAQ